MRVLKLRAFAKYWLPVIIWLAVIYSASGDKKSVQHSSRIIEPLVRWLIPQISDAAVHLIVLIVRKCAHMTEFGVLVLLVWRALRGTISKHVQLWSWRLALHAWLWVVAYAASDEFHQCFVPDRQASVLDVLIDATGAAMGLLLLWAIGRWRHKRDEIQQ